MAVCAARNLTGGACRRDAVLKGFCTMHFVRWQKGEYLAIRADWWIEDNGLRKL